MKKVLIFALMAGLWGCNDVGDNMGISVESASVELGGVLYGNVAQTRAVNAADPTMTPAAERTGHSLSVAIGGRTGVYSYSEGLWTITGIGVKFPGGSAADVDFVLAPQGADNPIAGQDGTAEKLLDADILTGKLIAQEPVNALPLTTLTHANTLLDFTVDLTPAELDEATVKVDGTLIPYRVSASSTQMQTVIAPGANIATILINIGTERFSVFVNPLEGNFKPNTRYTFRVIFDIQGVRIENVAVQQWNETTSTTGKITAE